MIRTALTLACLLLSLCLWASDDKKPSHPSFDYQAAYAHEIKPHRYTIPLKGVHEGLHQLHLTLTVSPTGEVLDAKADGDANDLKFWPQIEDEVRRWKFTPFEENGKPVTAEVEDYVNLAPPERMPEHHVTAPVIHPNSKVEISLDRSMCYGRCPVYKVTISTSGIVYEGDRFVATVGKQTDVADANDVRKLAQKFVDADFYSMEPVYRAQVTDNPTFTLSITIDGRTKKVVDYVGTWIGMPAVISDLEEEVDAFAHTERWIKSSDTTQP